MDIVAMPSGGPNVVGWPYALPPWRPAPTAPAASVDLYWRRLTTEGVPVGAWQLYGNFPVGTLVDVPFNPVQDYHVEFSQITRSADGTPSETDPELGVRMTTLFDRGRAQVAGIDEHVPTVTLAPAVAKAEGTDEWVVFTPAPDAHGATVTDGTVRVQKADDAAAFIDYPVPASPSHRIRQEGYACTIKYRWRNQSSEDAGNGRGVSAWSPAAPAAEAGAAAPPPPASEVVQTFDYDPADSRAGIERGIVI